jgi:hypothetical protein
MHSSHKITVLIARAVLAGGLAMSAFVLATANAHAGPFISAPLSQPCPGDNCDDPGQPPVPHTGADIPYVPPPPRDPHTGHPGGKDQTQS